VLIRLARRVQAIIESTKATPRIIKRRRDPLTTLSGLLSEASRIYRKMKAGQLDHEKGRSLVCAWARLGGWLKPGTLSASKAS